jgi:putative ABC transport system permease protein
MFRWLIYAFRNLLRNPRRSLFTIVAVAMGFGGINFFGGFTKYMFTNLRESFIYIEGNGHLSVFRAGFSSLETIDPLKALLTHEELAKIRAVAGSEKAVLQVAEEMAITGFVSNGSSTTVYVGVAWIPKEKYGFQKAATGLMSRLKFFEGKPLTEDVTDGVGVSPGLVKILNRQIGSDIILMAPTVQGQINALDARILQITAAFTEVLNDMWLVMPLNLARKLYDTEGASRVNLLIDERDDIAEVRSRLQEEFLHAGLHVEIVSWRELSPFYRKVENMFNIIFLLVFAIVATIIVMSVANTVSMSVLERSREIGTMRAIGARRARIVSLFGMEGGFLGMFGCILGFVLLILSVRLFNQADLQWTPPHLSNMVPLEIYLVPVYLAYSLVVLTTLAIVSGSISARKIAHANIVKTLNHD